jgi:putative SOS response-associated peptidase YedK
MKPTSKPKPVNNARDDKLQSFFWRDSFEKRRILIPVSQWAEPQGDPGQMTKTWYGLPEQDEFIVAGVWRPTDEWGDCYSMVMTTACEQMMEVHDRMPVILDPKDYDQWTQGTPDEAFALVKTYDGLLTVDATNEAWGKSGRTVPQQGSLI